MLFPAGLAVAEACSLLLPAPPGSTVSLPACGLDVVWMKEAIERSGVCVF